MNPTWQRLDALAGKAVNAVFSEMIRITPRLSASEYIAAAPDDTRPVKEVRAVFSEETASEDLRGQRVSGESRGTSRIVSSTSILQVMAAEAAKIGYELTASDLVTMIARPGSPSYSIVIVDVLDCGDIVVTMAREKAG